MLIAREKEKEILLNAIRAEEAQFIAVYGRRRVGKTYLIWQVYDGQFTFEHSGLSVAQIIDAMFFAEDAPMKDELAGT